MSIEKGLCVRFRVYMWLYQALRVIDGLVSMTTLTYVDAGLLDRYGMALLLRAL